MTMISDLHEAIKNGWVAKVKECVSTLKANNVNLDGELKYAQTLAQVKGGTWKKIPELVR